LLPGIEYEDLSGLRFYPDQPVRTDNANRNGVIGRRNEGTAMVASRPGEYVLPEVRLPWWNTTTDTLETAILPARTIRVLPATGSNGQPAFDPGSVPPPQLSNVAPQSIGTSAAPANPLWISTTILFALAWIFTLFLWLNGRRQLVYAETVGTTTAIRMPESDRKGKQPANQVALPEATASLRVLKTACDNANLADIKKAAIKWGQASFQTSAIQTLAQLGHYCRDENLAAQFKELDAALYGASSDQFASKSLYEALALLHKQGVPGDNKQGKYALPPLYKN